MRHIFLDTVGLLAIWNPCDQWHAEAEAAMHELNTTPCRFISTPYVMFECGNAMARSALRADVRSLRDELETHGNLIRLSDSEEQLAWEAYARGGAGQAGIIDHMSFVVMRRLGVTEVFTNDKHFATAGFVTLF